MTIIPCFILARKNSKGLKNKNIYNFNNEPLIEHTIKYAKNSQYVTDVVISTDSKKVLKIAKKYRAEMVKQSGPDKLNATYCRHSEKDSNGTQIIEGKSMKK